MVQTRNLIHAALVGALAAGLAACSGEGPDPCARIAAVQPGQWMALDLRACLETSSRLVVWQGGADGISPLGAETAPATAAACQIVYGGPPIGALAEGPWCASVLLGGLPEDALCVPEDVPGVDPGGELLLVRQGDGWIPLLPGAPAGCAFDGAIGG